MKRVLALLLTLFVALCTATLLAESLLLGYAGLRGFLTREKIGKMLAVAQGAELATPGKEPKSRSDTLPAEQPAFEQVVEARAAKMRNIELREQAVLNATAQLRLEQTKLNDAQAELKKTQQVFEEHVAAVNKQAVDSGWDTNRRDLSTIKPKLAKDLLMAMIKKDESKQVVSLLLPMSDTKRAKILAEFKTPEEAEKLDELLRLMRLGEPMAGMDPRPAQATQSGGAPAAQEARP